MVGNQMQVDHIVDVDLAESCDEHLVEAVADNVSMTNEDKPK